MTAERAGLDWILAALLAWCCWSLWMEYRSAAARHEIFGASRPAPAAPAGDAAPSEFAAPPRGHAPVLASLFQDASPNSAPGPAGPAQDPSAFPQLPVLHGLADLGNGPSALLSTGRGDRAQWTAPGEFVGEYQLAAVSQTVLVFLRDGVRYETSPGELRQNSAPRSPVRPVSPRARQGRAGFERRVSIRPAPSGGRFRIGTEFRPGRFAADAGDGAVDGTRFEGFVRRVRRTPFGEQHWWERTGGERQGGL